MKNKSYIPFLAVFGAILLAVMAAIAPSQSFLGRDLVHAQTIDDATLSGLTVSGVTLDPTFDSDTMDYSARVGAGTNKVTVTATLENSQATVTISPSDQDSGTPGDQVLLRGGANTVIRVMVRSEDRTVTETYTITIYQVRTTPSGNDNLSSLSLSGVTLSPSFSSSRTMYRGRAAYGTEETTLSYRKDIGAMAVIQDVNDSALADADTDASGHQVALAVGAVTEVNVVVTAEDGGEPAKTYTVMIYRENLVKSDNATLGTFTLNAGAADGTALNQTDNNFDFATTMMSYPNVRVGNGVRAVTVAATTAHAGAVEMLRPSDQDTEIDGHQVNLTAGAKTDITVGVTAEDGSAETYTATVYRERRVMSDDADLLALSLSDLTLSPAFASDKISYMARATYGTDETTVSYTPDIGAMVAIQDGNDAALADNDMAASGHQVALDAGDTTTIAVVVTAEDDGTTKTYTITVYRENLVRSDDPSLATANGLTLADGTTPITFDFAPVNKSYNVRVANGVDAVTVAANTTHMGAMAVITPSDQDSLTDGHQVLLAAGAKTNIMVEVTAEDGSATDTYNITVYRNRRVPVDDADLLGLSLSDVTLSPEFASNKTSYMARAEYSTDKVTVSTMTDVGATVARSAVTDGGSPVTEDADADASGYQVVLTAGSNTVITVTVTAENTTTTKPYTVTVYRENLPPSDNALLAAANATPAGLTLNAGAADGTALTNSDNSFEYAPDDMSYPNVRVGNSVQMITVGATPAHLGAMRMITPADQDSLTPGHQVILGAGAKTDIMVEVTAEDGTTMETYSITVYRERRVLSDNADLSALELSGVTLAPVFDPEKDEYTGTAAYSTQMTTVSTTTDIGARTVAISAGPTETAAITDANATEPGYQVRLIRGQAIEIRITVTAEGPTGTPATKTYTITVYRDNAPSSDTTLQSLSLSGLTLMPAFDSATTMYTAEVETLETTMVEAMATHPGAMVEGTGERALTAGENMISVTVTAEDETTQTYTVTVTVLMGGTLLDRYDANDNDRIDKEEIREAIIHYIRGDIDKAQMREVIILYITG